MANTRIVTINLGGAESNEYYFNNEYEYIYNFINSDESQILLLQEVPEDHINDLIKHNNIQVVRQTSYERTCNDKQKPDFHKNGNTFNCVVWSNAFTLIDIIIPNYITIPNPVNQKISLYGVRSSYWCKLKNEKENIIYTALSLHLQVAGKKEEMLQQLFEDTYRNNDIINPIIGGDFNLGAFVVPTTEEKRKTAKKAQTMNIVFDNIKDKKIKNKMNIEEMGNIINTTIQNKMDKEKIYKILNIPIKTKKDIQIVKNGEHCKAALTNKNVKNDFENCLDWIFVGKDVQVTEYKPINFDKEIVKYNQNVADHIPVEIVVTTKPTVANGGFLSMFRLF